MSKFLEMMSKVFYVLAILSIGLSVYVYQNDSTLGIFIGLWVPTLLLLGPSCPWSAQDEWVGWAGSTTRGREILPAKLTNRSTARTTKRSSVRKKIRVWKRRRRLDSSSFFVYNNYKGVNTWLRTIRPVEAGKTNNRHLLSTSPCHIRTYGSLAYCSRSSVG